MKQVKLFGRIFFFFFFLFGILKLTSYFFAPKNNLSEFGMQQVSANGILGEKNHTIDLMVVGDSESFTSISPMQLWESYGFTSYVSGTSSQPIFDSYAYLLQAFETQSPKVVILETNTIYRKTAFGRSLGSELEYWFPVFRYHNRWKSLSVNDFGGKVKYTWTDDLKGFNYNISVKASTKKDHMKKMDFPLEIPSINERYLKKIVALCEEHDAKLLLVSTPSTKNWNDAKHRGVAAFADAYGIPYLDLNLIPEVLIDWTTDTRDHGDHLNYYGAVKVTSFLGAYLDEKKLLSDHRSDRRYQKWEEASKRYKALVNGSK